MDHNSNRVIFFIIVMFIFSVTLPIDSFAGWKDKSDELPGFDTGQVLLYVVGAVAVVTVIYLVSKSNDNADTDAGPNAVVADSSSATLFQPNAFSMALVQTQPVMEIEEPGVIPFVGIQSEPAIIGYKGNKGFGRVVLGVSLKF